jgi:hypothetical protein
MMTPRQRQQQREEMINTLSDKHDIRVRLECGTWYGFIGMNLIDRLVHIRTHRTDTRWVRWEEIAEVEKY